ncbi:MULTISPECIES: DAHL domain-containing protein [unclassified Ensifer]|uniref:DAHL domain-containing protein n=1 Tax=unclassified Ensifer TaxID=2633371 RepID=UPI0008131EBC|nr:MULTISPECIES: DAHL domain-containing protein [unclassified Ensifer]OCP23594.1 hypothetical protein BC363_24505 [Ensifer sp. LC384]OCP24281.1 hypothetical protein BC361_20985 [Ensifer sp. LC54]
MNKLSVNFIASNRAWAFYAGFFVILSVTLAALFWSIQSSKDTLTDFRQQFERMRDLETKWDNEILSLQLGIASNYDRVTSSARDLKLGVRDLEKSVSLHDDLASLLAGVQAYRQAIEQKDWLSEQVKASYAMLRNSISVLPNAVSDAYRHPAISQPIAELNRRPSDLITEAITSMLSFATAPTASLRDTVLERLSATRAATKSLPPGLSDAIERFLVQSEVVIKERQRGNAVMLDITAIPSAALSNDIQARLQSLELRNTEAQRRALLGGLSALVLAAIVIVIWRRFAKLNKDNRMLHQANETVEQQLMQSAKLSSLGQMVAGITHEINTPLAYVKAVFEVIKERVVSEPEMIASDGMDEDDADVAREWREELETLLDDGLHGLEEMAALVRTMKNFSRLDKGEVERFNVEQEIENALLIAQPQLKQFADTKREYDSVPHIIGSPSQLRQVLLNLIINSAQAMATMDRRGLLIVRTRLTSSDTVQIEFCDNGPGISEEHLAKVFDPFFTTKAIGEGTGMGLSISYRIVENHGGTIAVNSRLGKGTVFTVTLPRQDEKSTEVAH